MKSTLPLLFLLAGALLSCQQEAIPLFDSDEAGVYFCYRSSWVSNGTEYYADSIAYSFGRAEKEATEHTIEIPVVVMGKVVDYPRPVRVTIDNARTTATAGVHYQVDLQAVVIPPGAGSTTVPVRFFRVPEMLEREFRVALALEENEHFRLHIREQKNTNLYTAAGERVSATRMLMVASELYTEPFYWRIFCTERNGWYFGPWSAAKYTLVNSIAGWTDADWATAGSTASPVQLGRFGYIALLVQKHLQALADAGTPAREADGSLMQQGGVYAVDYSAYE